MSVVEKNIKNNHLKRLDSYSDNGLIKTRTMKNSDSLSLAVQEGLHKVHYFTVIHQGKLVAQKGSNIDTAKNKERILHSYMYNNVDVKHNFGILMIVEEHSQLSLI